MKTYKIEPFTQVINTEITRFASKLFFKRPGHTIKTRRYQDIEDQSAGILRIFTFPYFAGSEILLNFYGTEMSEHEAHIKFSLQTIPQVHGTLIAGVSHKGYAWPKHEKYTESLYRDFKCTVFCVPYSWSITKDYYYAIFFHKDHRILSILPTTLI